MSQRGRTLGGVRQRRTVRDGPRVRRSSWIWRSSTRLVLAGALTCSLVASIAFAEAAPILDLAVTDSSALAPGISMGVGAVTVGTGAVDAVTVDTGTVDTGAVGTVTVRDDRTLVSPFAPITVSEAAAEKEHVEAVRAGSPEPELGAAAINIALSARDAPASTSEPAPPHETTLAATPATAALRGVVPGATGISDFATVRSVVPEPSMGLAGTALPGPATGSRGIFDPLEPGVADRDVVPVARTLDTTNGSVTLKGTLLLPPGDGPFPAVVLVMDQGQETLARSLPDATLFVQAGVAAYVFEATQPMNPGGITTATRHRIDDLIGNAVAAVKAVRRSENIDPERVGVWGVGEGGWVLPFVGAQEDVAFLILVNTAFTTLGQRQLWEVGNAMHREGVAPARIETTMRGMQLSQSVRPILARVRPIVADAFPGLALPEAGDDPNRSPVSPLRSSRAPILALYDGGPDTPVVRSAATLRGMIGVRDQPFDVITVLDHKPHAFESTDRSSDPAYRNTVIGWTRTVLSGGATIEPLDPEAVRGMSRGFAPIPTERLASINGGTAPAAGMQLAGAGTAGAAGNASGTDDGWAGARVANPSAAAGPLVAAGGSRWYAGAGAGTPWYAGVWFQVPVLAFFVLVFTLGLLASLLPPRRIGGLVEGGRKRGLLRLTQGLLSFVDLALLAGLALVVSRLLGLNDSAVPIASVPLGEALRALSVASSVLAIALAALLVFGPAAPWRSRRSGVAISVALAAALFLPYLVYWRVPFLAG